MKKNLTAIILSLLFTSVYGQSPDQLIQGYLKSIGGSMAIKKVNTKTMEAVIESPNGEIFLTYYWTRPHLYRGNMKMPDGNTLVTLLNGTEGRMMMGDNPALETNEDHTEDLKWNEASIDDIFVDYAKNGHSARYDGTESINGKNTFKIVLTVNGREQTYWFDETSKLLVKYKRTVIGPTGETELVRELSDYTEVGGILYPFTYESVYGPTSYTTKIKSVKINEPLEDSLFNLPN